MASPQVQKASVQPFPSSSPGPPTPGPSKLRQPRASLAIELSSGSDNDDERAARLAQNEKARAAKRFKDLDRVKAAIPDVDPRVILEMFRNPKYRQDPDLVASAILESNYRLRDGGWKWGYDPEVGPSGDDLASGSGNRDSQKRKKKVRRAENDSDSDSNSADDRRASSHKAGNVARKSPKQKRARQQSSDDEEQDGDDEVDQLASDNDGAGSGQDDDEEEEELTYEETMEQEGYWLNPEDRDPPEESYRKAALNRLFRDYNKYAENHIRSRFESDECDGKYAPAWFDLRRLQSQGDLLQLKGPPRDMDAPIILQDGTKRARKPIEKSQTLEKDARWLAHYIRYGGKGLLKKQKEAKKDQNKKRKSESLEARRARLSGGEAVQKKKKQKKKAVVRDDSDEEDLARSSDDDLTPIASISASSKARVKAKPKSPQAKKRRVHFTRDDDEGECWDDFFGHGANTDGWGPAYQDKPSTSAAKGQKKKQKPAVGSWASSSSGAFNVKEEEREWFVGQGRRLGD